MERHPGISIAKDQTISPPGKQHIQSLRAKPFAIVLTAALFLASVGFFALIAHEVVGEKEDWFDSSVFDFFKSHFTGGWVSFFHSITFFGSTGFLLSAYITIVIYLFAKHRKAEAYDVIIISSVSTGMLYLLKAIYSRHRPDLPIFKTLNTYSFPSGHALTSFIFFSVLVYFVFRSNWKIKWKWILSGCLILFSILIGISRIVLRYHYASDVLAGIALGISWVMLSFWIQRRLRARESASQFTGKG